VQLENTVLTEMSMSNAFEITSQNESSFNLFSKKGLLIYLLDTSGQIIKKMELKEGDQEVILPFNRGVYLLTDFQGTSLRVML
jgi:hypothetical protein